MRHLSKRIVALWVLLLSSTAACQVYKTSFEEGDKNPTGWEPRMGACAWVSDRAHTGKRCVSITGNGEDQSLWQSTDLKFEPGRFYRMTFFYCSNRAGEGGCCTNGAGFAYRDFGPPKDWKQDEIIFQVPQEDFQYCLRLAQWHLPGTVYLDDVTRERVGIAYARRDGIVLGKDEKIEKGTYTFKSDLGTKYSNCFRVVDEQKLTYHSGWYEFRDNTCLIFRFQVGDCKQLSAGIKFLLARSERGACIVAASTDKKNWRELGRVSADGEHAYDLPKEMFPAGQVFVRLSVDGATCFNLNRFEYTAKLDGSPPDLVGSSRWFRGRMVTVDTGPVQWVFEEGRPELMEVRRGAESVGSLRCAIAQFEKKGIGYKKTGVGLAEATTVKSVQLKQKDPRQCVIEVVAARAESEETRRCFEATYRFEAVAGQGWVRCRLMSVKNVDPLSYELRGHCCLLQPAVAKDVKPVNFPECAGWIRKDTIFGCLSPGRSDFVLSFRRQDNEPHGEATRAVDVGLPSGKLWQAAEPDLIVLAANGSDERAMFQKAEEIQALLPKPPGEIASGDIRYVEETEEQTEPEKKP